jgi:hypothetical protein
MVIRGAALCAIRARLGQARPSEATPPTQHRALTGACPTAEPSGLDRWSLSTCPVPRGAARGARNASDRAPLDTWKGQAGSVGSASHTSRKEQPFLKARLDILGRAARQSANGGVSPKAKDYRRPGQDLADPRRRLAPVPKRSLRRQPRCCQCKHSRMRHKYPPRTICQHCSSTGLTCRSSRMRTQNQK